MRSKQAQHVCVQNQAEEMALSTAILLCSLAIIGGAFGGRYSGQQTAQSEGDDPNASGKYPLLPVILSI